MIRNSLALAAGAIALPLLSGSSVRETEAGANGKDVELEPRYYPRNHFKPEIDLRGKLAVITGASRGIGRAIGDALLALGVDVIGTSRNPAVVPNRPAFPLLALDIADPASVYAFAGALRAHALFQRRGRLDILANNAGRFVAGEIVPLSPADFAFYLAQRELGLRTNYSGHVLLTNLLLPLMPWMDYSRILFTVSIDSYSTGATITKGLADVYHTGKAALRAYANNLDAALIAGGTSIRVSTVNPYGVKTAIFKYPNPIYTQPVNGSGLSDTDPNFNAAAIQFQRFLDNALPPSMVGETYAHLLQMARPEQNVVVASPHKPLSTQGANALIESGILDENRTSAIPFVCP